MLNSDKKALLIEIHLTNGTGYNNSTYGIVDGVMYLTTGSLDYSYDTHSYKAGLVYSVDNIENALDILGNIGGYKTFNEFQFEIIDEGLSAILKAESINIYRNEVVVYVSIDTNVYDAYYGCVSNVSSTNTKLKIVTEDISALKEIRSMNKHLLGEWNDNTTTRSIDTSELDIQTNNPKYAMLFWGTSNNPNNISQGQYDAYPERYISKIAEVGESSNKFYIDIYADLYSDLLLNPYFTTLELYEGLLKYYNIEIIDEDDNVTDLFYVYDVVYDTGDNDRVRFTVHTDPSGLNINTDNVRVCKANTVYTTSLNSVNSNLIFDNNANYNPMIRTSGTVVSSDSFFRDSDASQSTEYGSLGNLLPTTIRVPSTLYTNLVSDDESFVVLPDDPALTPDDMEFSFDTLGTTPKIATIQKNSTLSHKCRIALSCQLDVSDVPEGTWNIGFNIWGENVTNVEEGLAITDGEDLTIFANTFLNNNQLRPIEIGRQSINLSIGKNVFRYRTTSPLVYESFIGISPIPFNNEVVDYTTPANQVLGQTSSALSFVIDKQNINQSLNIQISFPLNVRNEAVYVIPRMDIYMPTFFFYKNESIEFTASTTIDEAEGEKWTADPKYTGGASDTFPRTRTEMCRYLLDIYGEYDETTEYANDIFLPTTEDFFPVAYNTYTTDDKNTRDVIHDLLDGSNFMLTGNMLGNRRMLNTYTLAGDPTSVTKAIVGSLDQVSLNGYYGELNNAYTFEFDANDLYYSAVYSKTFSEVRAESNYPFNTASSTSLLDMLNNSIDFNTATDTKKITSNHTNFGSTSQSPLELRLLSDVYAWAHYKFSIKIDMEDHFTSPVYIGDWISFRDLVYTDDTIIFGLVQGVQVNFQSGIVTISCVSPSIYPDAVATILDEQPLNGLLLDEETGGDPLDEG